MAKPEEAGNKARGTGQRGTGVRATMTPSERLPPKGPDRHAEKPKWVITSKRTVLPEGTEVQVQILGKDWVSLSYEEEVLRVDDDGRMERGPAPRAINMKRSTFDKNAKKTTEDKK